MHFVIPPLLAKHCSRTTERRAWLAALPDKVRALEVDWSISLSAPFDHDYVSCSWVAPAVLRDGTRAVLKVGMPHMEAEQEIEGLTFWDGDATVRVLQSDLAANAMLLERCEPGLPLLSVAETTQDVVITAILKRLWRKPSPGVFRPLASLTSYWSHETRQAQDTWSDPVLVNEGLQVLANMAEDATNGVLLATDLHGGNVLQAEREPWLMIDPKPFVGDRAYDLTQHLFNCEQRLQDDPYALIRRVSDLAEVDAERVRMWLFARAAAEPRQSWLNDWKMELARKLSR
jgi:streptomycin 6-kinase